MIRRCCSAAAVALTLFAATTAAHAQFPTAGMPDQPVSALQGHCFSYASTVPYLPILEMIRSVAGLAETDTPDEAAEMIRRFVERIGMDPGDATPKILHLLGIKNGAEGVAALSQDIVRTRTIETLHAMFLRTSERSPLTAACPASRS